MLQRLYNNNKLQNESMVINIYYIINFVNIGTVFFYHMSQLEALPNDEPCNIVVLNLGSIEPRGSVSQFQGFGGKRF